MFGLDYVAFVVDSSNEVVLEARRFLLDGLWSICVQISNGLIDYDVSLVHLLWYKLDVFESTVGRGLRFLLVLPNGLKGLAIASEHLSFGSLMSVHLTHRVLFLNLNLWILLSDINLFD